MLVDKVSCGLCAFSFADWHAAEHVSCPNLHQLYALLDVKLESDQFIAFSENRAGSCPSRWLHPLTLSCFGQFAECGVQGLIRKPPWTPSTSSPQP